MPAPGAAIAIAALILPAEPIVQVRGETPDVSSPPAVHSRLSTLCVLIC